MNKTCIVCTKELQGLQKRFCSPACTHTWHYAHVAKSRRQEKQTTLTLERSQVKKVCPVCETEFLEGNHKGRPKVFCSRHCTHISACRTYIRTENGLTHSAAQQRRRRIEVPDVVAASQVKYFASPKGIEARRRFEATASRKAKQKIYRHTYFLGEKGQAYLERHKDTWRGLSRYMIYVENRPCAQCGETNKLLLECDHILPRALGGSDDLWNLQVLCECCHSIKTKSDLYIIKAR